jgi:hypothetical protein
MKFNSLKTLVIRNRARCSLGLLAFLISIWFALTPGAAQSKFQKRITSLQIGEGTEGARVTVVSDSLLNDYEAFRRGDRFYVRIPLADFTAGKPGFRGDGFEDVQVQKVGDSVVVSFKLQPGASARVDQHSNRLDVIFSAPNRMPRTSRANSGSNHPTYIPTDGIVRASNSQTMQHRQRDGAGPMPPDSPGSPTATRDRVVAGRPSEFGATRNPSRVPSPRDEFNRRGTNRSAGGIASSTTTAVSPGVSKAAPSSGISTPRQTSNTSKAGSSTTISKYESSPAAVPSASPNYQAVAPGTPAAPIVSPAVKSPGLSGPQNAKSRSDIAIQWVKANRQSALIAGLLGLFLLVFLVALLVRRRKNMDKAKRSGKTLAQPKQSGDVALSSPPVSAAVNSPAANVGRRDFVNAPDSNSTELNPPTVPAASANGARTTGIPENGQRANHATEPAMAQSAAAAPNQAWVPASSSQGSSADEDPEREVFEL